MLRGDFPRDMQLMMILLQGAIALGYRLVDARCEQRIAAAKESLLLLEKAVLPVEARTFLRALARELSQRRRQWKGRLRWVRSLRLQSYTFVFRSAAYFQLLAALILLLWFGQSNTGARPPF